MAAPSLEIPVRTASNFEKMKVQILRTVKDFEMRTMLQSTSCRPWDQVYQRFLRQYLFQRVLERPGTEFQIAVNGCDINSADTKLSKRVYLLSKCPIHITVLPIMNLKIERNLRPQWLEQAYRLWEFTIKWLNIPNYHDYRLLFTIQDEWTILKCIMECLWSFRYWT
jgi:hypothetical protein